MKKQPVTLESINDHITGMQTGIKSVNAQIIDMQTDMKSVNVKITDTRADMKAVNAQIIDMRATMATKDDLKAFATKSDLQQVHDSLIKKMAENHQRSIKYHLKTQSRVGETNKRHTELTERLAQATESSL